MGHADVHLGKCARVFSELKSGLETGRNGGPRPSQDEDKLDINQLFVDLSPHADKDRPLTTVRIGRQELNYGEGTLLAIRELNVRRTFDGVKVILQPLAWRIDALVMRPAQTTTGFFDDTPDPSQTLWGVWAVKTNTGPSFFKQLDVYYLGLDRKQARFDKGVERDQRHTLGVNVHVEKGALASFVEGDLQFGRFGEGEIRAWKYAQRVSYSFARARLQPVMTVQGAVSSGDKNPAAPGLQTFYPLFPKGLYYGYIDDSGSLNAIVIHPAVSFHLSQTLSLAAEDLSFWREQTTDGLYSQPGFLLRTGRGTQARYVGNLQDLVLQWRIDRDTGIEFIASYYKVGPYLRQTSPIGRNIFYGSLKMDYRF